MENMKRTSCLVILCWIFSTVVIAEGEFNAGVHPKLEDGDQLHKRVHDKDVPALLMKQVKNLEDLKKDEPPKNNDKNPNQPLDQSIKMDKAKVDYLPIPQDLKEYVEQFKRNLTECLKEVKEKDGTSFQQLSPKVNSPITANCLVACVLRKNTVIVQGKINRNNLLDLIGKFYSKDVKLMKKLEKNMDKCIALAHKYKDECKMAAQLNLCTDDIMNSIKHPNRMS